MKPKRKNTVSAAIIGAIAVLLILVAGTVWMAEAARRDTNEAVRSVSLLYLDELAGRREQVVASNLQESINTVNIAVRQLTDEDLSDDAHRQAFQRRMKELYHLDRFAFIGREGTIYTSGGRLTSTESELSAYRAITEPEIFVTGLGTPEKKVVIAVPIAPRSFLDDKLVVCFMQIDMEQMLDGVSMRASENSTTFCNIYTKDGISLTNAVLGGLAEEDNLLDALRDAQFVPGDSFEEVARDFEEGNRNVVSFRYNGIQETLSYVPVEGTNWLLTYLIRESVISEEISSISNGIILRSVAQSLLTVLALVAMFAYIMFQSRKNAMLRAAQEAADTEHRIKQEEMEQRLALQEKLLEQKAQGEQQSQMITALSSDYRSVYYLELDKDAGICYQSRTDLHGFRSGERFPYLASVTAYCNQYVLEPFRDEFLRFKWHR